MKKYLFSLITALALPSLATAQNIRLEIVESEYQIHSFDGTQQQAVEFHFQLQVTPEDSDLWMYRLPERELGIPEYPSISWTLLRNGVEVVPNYSTAVMAYQTGIDQIGSFLQVDEAETGVLNLSVWVEPQTTGIYRLELDDLRWSSSGPNLVPEHITSFTTNNQSDYVFVQGVPEPSSALLATVGGIGFLSIVRRRR